MFARIRIFLSLFGLISLLAACGPAPAVNPITAPPTATVEAVTPIPPAMALTQANLSFDCSAIQQLPLEECQALVALYESTAGEGWADHSGWLVTQTPCTWYGVICEQGHVVELQLYYNQLGGSLPHEIGNLTSLKSLYLDDSELGGPIPAEIGNLAELQVLRLGRNQFTSIPAELANLNKLIEFELSGNQLSGELPGWLGDISSLQVLNLNSNQLTGEIPLELSKLAFLHELNLSHNQLSGSIPATLGDLRNLNQLNLSFNQLSGSIPPELEQLDNLYLLDLSYNQLTGTAPAFNEDSPMFERRLWGNLLDGTVLAAQDAITSVDEQGVYFQFNSDLFKSVWPEIVAAFPASVGGPGWEAKPEHRRFTFSYLEGSIQLQAAGGSAFGPPHILIFPAETYSTINEFAREEIVGLQTLLETRPAAPENEIPFLPLINAAQIFHTELEYLEFQNGTGVRFITHYSQDMGPITNENTFYTFQGLTDDGEYYVAAYFPISAAGLSNELPQEDWQAFNERYPDYLRETVIQLDALSPEDFEPNLEVLDAVIQSLVVDTR